MMEVFKSKHLQKSITQTLLKGNTLLLNRTNNSICQKRLIYNTKNDIKLVLSSPLNNVLTKRDFTKGIPVKLASAAAQPVPHIPEEDSDKIIGNKNYEMWQKYRAIDPRVIRPVDGTEFFVSDWYINLADVFPKISAEEFKKRAEENLSKIELFNYALKRINGHLFFIRKPFKMHLEEVEYTEDEEMENFLKTKDKMIIPYKLIQEKDDKDVQALFSFKICQLQKSNQTKITLSISHAIIDGRSIFIIMDYIRKIINGESIEGNDEQLPNFGGLERFKDLDESYFEPPKNWNEIPKLQIYPQMKPPFKFVRPHIVYDYKPISKFIHENGITIQAMLMAAITRSIRQYNNLPKETPIWNTTPCDTRTSPHATEEYKNRKFFTNIGVMTIKLIGQSNLMEDLKHCMIQLKEAKKKDDGVRQLICASSILDPKTLKFIPMKGFPNQQLQPVVNSTNVGKVNGVFPILNSSNNPYGFVFSVSSYHTDNHLFITILRPYDFDKTYIDILTEELNKIFIPENISKF